jgi:oligopeptide transport system ATP-binding protein
MVTAKPESESKSSGKRGTHVKVSDLCVELSIGGSLQPILTNISFEIAPGQTLGLVGESGSGKSMTARAIARLLPDRARVHGKVEVGAKDVLGLKGAGLRQYRAQDVAIIFQDPRAHVNPVRSVGDFLTEGMRLTGKLSRREAERRAVGLLDDVGISQPTKRLRQYPHELSGGMLQRVVIAAALAAEPALVLADEPTTALDVTVQAEIMALINELKVEHHVAILLITHDLEMAAAVCERTAVMYAGQIVESRTSTDFFGSAHHPYSQGLLAARPRLEGGEGPLLAIAGQPEAPYEVATACVFASRCPRQTDVCKVERPRTIQIGSDPANLVRCHHAEVSSA